MTVALVACGGGTDEAADEQILPDTTATATPPAATPPPAGGTAQLPEGVTAEMVTAGQQIFTGAGNCFTCHGDDGSGTALAPNLRDSEWINLTEGSIEEIVQLVHTGVPTPQEHPAPMPPMGG
ncbi:MAG: c-type cytochrome, partial [Longimicrobiales bacterium]